MTEPSVEQLEAAKAAWAEMWGEEGAGEMYEQEIVTMLRAALSVEVVNDR